LHRSDRNIENTTAYADEIHLRQKEGIFRWGLKYPKIAEFEYCFGEQMPPLIEKKNYSLKINTLKEREN